MGTSIKAVVLSHEKPLPHKHLVEREGGMAFPKTLAHRFLAMAKVRGGAVGAPAASAQDASIIEPGRIRRFLQRRPFFQPAMPPDRTAGFPAVAERIRWGGDRIRLDGLLPPPEAEGMTVEDLKKVLRASQMEKARGRLREIQKGCVSYKEFLRICCEASSAEQGPGIALSLDESGAVIVLGEAVLLRPDQVAKAIQSMISVHVSPQHDWKNQELIEMEEKKAIIDKKAEALVKRELWCGLGFFIVQTLGLMRLTFWELSWDVMEPVCFYLTSIYFMSGYAFFLRTSKEPTFEGFFESRVATRQKRLMKAQNFDINRFKELKGVSPGPHSLEELSTSPYCNCSRRDPLLNVAH